MIEGLRPVWLEFCPGAAAKGFDTGKRRFFKTYSLVFYQEMNGTWDYTWTSTSNLIDRT